MKKPITKDDIPAIWLFILDSQNASEAFIENVNNSDWDYDKTLKSKTFFSFVKFAFPSSETDEGLFYWDNIARQKLCVPEPKNFAPVNWEKLLSDLGFNQHERYDDLLYLSKNQGTISTDRRFGYITMNIKLDRDLSNLAKCLKFLNDENN